MRKLKNEELNRPSVEEYRQLKKLPVSIILDNIRSLNNVGSAFRTADSFLVDRLYLAGITGKPHHRDIEKTALGATESVRWSYHEKTLDLVRELKSAGHQIIGIEQADRSIPLQDFNPENNRNLVFIFGNEVFGIDNQVFSACDKILEIPQSGTKHSLNISVSLGIVLWEVYRKLFLK